jgi:hypothetical protein
MVMIIACLIMTFMVKNKIVNKEDGEKEHHPFVE